MIMIHQLKIKKEYFHDVCAGEKTFEIRQNDRGFMVGDYVALNRIDENGMEDGSCALFQIEYVFSDANYVKEGFVILTIAPCVIEKTWMPMTAPIYTRRRVV